MNLKERRVSEVLGKLFYFTCAILIILLIYTALSLNARVVKSFDAEFFLLKLLGGLFIWGAVVVLLINSIKIARDYENKLKWRKKDLKWIRESISKLERLLQLPEADLRRKTEESITANIKIDNAGYQAEISTDLIPIENIRLLLERSRDSLVKQSQEKTMPSEPKIFKFWKKTLSLFLESQNSELQSGY